MKITCHKHKSFRGVRKPTSGCLKCRLVWLFERAKKLFGFEYAKPQRTTFPGIAFGVDPHPFRVSVKAQPAGLMITEEAKRELAKIRAAVPLIDVKTPSGILSADADGRVLQKKVEPPLDQCDG